MGDTKLKGRVMITRPCHSTYDFENIVSVEGMRLEANKEGWGCNFHFCKGSNIARLREQGIEIARKSKSDYMLCVDSDIIVMRDTLVRLLSYDVDIISGVMVSKQEPYNPIISNKKDKEGNYYPVRHLSSGGIMEVDRVGFGCILIKTLVFDKIDSPCFAMEAGRGEDYYFCEKAQKAGFKIWVDTSCNLAHIGQYYYTVNDFHACNPELRQEPKLVTPQGEVLVN